MSELSPRQAFSPSCPSGGTWYACSTDSLFVGCCNGSVSPCALGCPDGLLEPASFDPAYWGTFPDQECSIGSQWYTCANSQPPFMGCCKTNPCNAGCPTGDLTPGYLSSDQALAAPFESDGSAPSGSAPSTTVAGFVVIVTVGPPIGSLPPSSTIATATTASAFPSFGQSTTASSIVITPSMTATGNAVAVHSGSTSTPTSGPVLITAVVGGIGGGAAIVALLLGLSLYLWRQHTFRREKEHLGPKPFDPQENAYTDSSPITPIQAYRTFNFPQTDKEYGSSSSSSRSTRKVPPSFSTHPAHNASACSRPPPAGPLSRSLSELESGRDGIKVAAELEGNALSRLKTKDLGREGKDAEIESPVDPSYRVYSPGEN